MREKPDNFRICNITIGLRCQIVAAEESSNLFWLNN